MAGVEDVEVEAMAPVRPQGQGREGGYSLLRQTSRWARFARVTVRVEAAAEPGVRMGPAPLGPAGPVVGQQARAEALEGAWYALAQLPDEARGLLVTVVAIVTSPADTGHGDVKFAAAHAVWRAAAREPGRRPWIDEDGTPVFPS